jgi:hypothetical protein
MDHSYKTEFGRLFDILEQSREMEIHQNLQALQFSFQVFEGNFAELVKLLEPLEDPRESLLMYAAPDKRENLDHLIVDTKRLLHNFLASAKSLVDHTRVIVNRLYPEDHEFRIEYQKKLNQDLSGNALQKFVQNLRNYTQHYTLPVLALQISFSSDSNELNSTLRIDVEILKQWDKWGGSKAYLESLENGLPVIALASGYYILIQDFYIWLSDRQSDIHQVDFDNLEKMREKLVI